jgi:hypothetical protein
MDESTTFCKASDYLLSSKMMACGVISAKFVGYILDTCTSFPFLLSLGGWEMIGLFFLWNPWSMIVIFYSMPHNY